MTSFYESVQDAPPKEGLRQAFELFNEMSQQLTESYTKLEHQVQTLSGELAEVSAARMEELKEKERLADRLHSLLQLLPGGVVVLDGQGRVQECNRAALAIFDVQDLRQKLWREVIKEHFSPKEDDGHEVSLRTGKRLSIQTSGLENEPGQIVLMTDQTETRDLQDKLAHHQRLMAMGKMVASLAHQVRTPLSGAMLYAEHLSNEDLESDTRFNFSKKLMRQLKSIEAQVRDMMIFARGSAPLNQQLNGHQLQDLLNDSIQMLSKQYPNALLNIEAEDIDQVIQCHTESLIGAVQNLISNGIEAAENQANKAQVKVNLKADEQGLVISVCDNGPGLSEEDKQKMSEPFYTTKSNGTGLGIPVVTAVIRAHHGSLQFFNQPQGGACFQVHIPFVVTGEE
ncbi:sensor histidine kinase [Bermanella sp. R86510]|uniref:sensor histidine kinase n=1 Tax=unclassified Bermanella TaxID=2627862 RepID=UPI0037C6BF08